MQKVYKIFVIIILSFIIIGNVFGISLPNVSKDIDQNYKPHDAIVGTAQNIWATIASVVQFLAIGIVVFAGIRYMFASADTRADIKREMFIMLFGAALVFGASTVIKIVIATSNDVMNGVV